MFKGLRATLDLPPIWMVAFGLVGKVLAWVVPVPMPGTGPLGPLLFWIGLGIIGWSAWWFWRKSTPIEPGSPPRALIVEGPYRINRNPIYTGLTLILLGWCLGQGALIALLPAVVYPVFITRRFILSEEAALRAAFGAEAEAYFSRSRRW